MSYARRSSNLVSAIALFVGTSSIACAAEPASRVTAATARATALAAVPSGSVQSAELETEHGRHIWSFDIKQANSTDVVEVQIDAKTGALVSKTLESTSDQRKEARADRKMKH